MWKKEHAELSVDSSFFLTNHLTPSAPTLGLFKVIASLTHIIVTAAVLGEGSSRAL